MFKKVGLTAVISAAILFGGATATSAASVSDQPTNTSHKTQVYYLLNGKWQQFSGDKIFNLFSNCFPGIHIDWDKQQTDNPSKEEDKSNKEDKIDKEENNQPKEEPEEQPEEQPVEKPTEQPEAPAQQEKPAEQPNENQDQANQTDANNQLSQYEQQVVELTNQERAKHGLAPLKADWELSRVAKEKSNDMAKNNYFSHNSPVYGSPFDMMKSYGINYQSAGENIARGQRTPQEVVDGWMNSEGHRANILNGNFTHIGVGFVEQGNYWTQQFITK